MAWRPLLDGDDRARALALVAAIADEVDARAPADPSLAFGQAGIALLHGYRARAGADDGADRAFAALERALGALATAPVPWLYRGTAGVGFVVHHLADVVGEAADVLAAIDGLVARALDVAPPETWDLTDGTLGLGVYGLERGAPALVARATAHVTAAAERGPDGATWRSFEADAPEGFHNLGLAHGVAGVIAFLAEASAGAPGPAGADAVALVDDAVRWLRARERAHGREHQRVPMFEPDIGRGPTGLLDGWCYGEPSVAIALVRAGRLVDRAAWVEAGRALAHHAAARDAAALAELTIDHSLCHGAISHAHLLARLAHALDDDAALAAAARRWCRRVLDGDVVAAVREPGLQLGLAGVGLGLLAAATDVEPAWDRALLLSPTPAARSCAA